MNAVTPKVKAFLNGTAIGILVFLLWDVLTNAWQPADEALTAHHYGSAVGNAAVMLGCAGPACSAWCTSTAGSPGGPAGPPRKGRAPPRPGRTGARRPSSAAARAAQLFMLIAVGIGMHNFGEGLAIGTSAAAGRLSLAVLLVIGFGAHNATEGFGIVAPLAAAGERPSWGRLALLGLIGGGPTFGAVVGEQVTSTVLGVAFLALAAGSILYVVIELLAVARNSGFKVVITWAIFLGIVLGFATDAIVTAAGA